MSRIVASVLLLWFATGCATAPGEGDPPAVARFFLESEDADGVLVTLPESGSTITVSAKPVLTEFDLARVELAQVELGRCLLFQLTPAAAHDLGRLIGANQGRRLVLVVNGRAMGARRIDRPVNDGALYMFVETPDDALPTLRKELQTTARKLQGITRKT